MTVQLFKKTLLVLCMVSCLALGFSWLYLFFYYHDGHLPVSPQPEIGRVYPSNNHGSVVYLTRAEDNLLTGLGFSVVVPFFIGYALNKRWRVFTQSQ